MAFLLYVLTQLSDFLLVLGDEGHVMGGHILIGVCICVQEVEHQFQGVSVQVHVEAVLAQHEHDGGGTDGQPLTNTRK